jgi:hypothetical protein
LKVVLFIFFSSFSVFSQENSPEEKTNRDALEHAREERLRLQEEMKMNKIIYQKSVTDYRSGYRDLKNNETYQQQLKQDRLEIRLNRIRFEESEKEFKRAVKEDRYQRSLEKKYAVGFYPFTSILRGGLKFDFGMRIAEKQWIQIVPAVYFYPGVISSYSYFSDDDDDHYYDYDYFQNKYNIKSQKGAGLDLNYKFFLCRNFSYLLAGVNYSYYHIDYQYYDYSSFEEDGLNYYKYMKVSDMQNFNNFGLYCAFGLQTTMCSGFFVGGHAGFGFQYSSYDSVKSALDNDFFDYGWRGLYPFMDFKMGYAW